MLFEKNYCAVLKLNQDGLNNLESNDENLVLNQLTWLDIHASVRMCHSDLKYPIIKSYANERTVLRNSGAQWDGISNKFTHIWPEIGTYQSNESTERRVYLMDM